jgi:branched-subunit amino acid transport protein
LPIAMPIILVGRKRYQRGRTYNYMLASHPTIAASHLLKNELIEIVVFQCRFCTN